MSILITGTTGTVSTALLHSLAATGHPPLRALVRDPAKAPTLPGVEIVQGDLDEPGTLAPALAGVHTLWLLTAMGPDAPHATSNAIWAARHAGVTHIVRLSAVGAAHDAPTRNGRLHALSEAELRASGIDWTIIRPHYFMQNLLGSLVGDTLYGALGDGRLGMIDTRDVADFAAHVLTDPKPHAGRTYTITGPASVSLHDVASAAAQAINTPVKYHPLSPEQGYRAMLDAGLPPWNAAVNTEYAIAYTGGWGDYTTPDYTKVVGRPARGVADFVHDHAEALRGR
jgi:uncharacterized protein YbjT (DUF2867 family)